MTPVMKNAPLVHVIADISFSRLPEPATETIEHLHSELLDAGFPERIDATLQTVELVFPVPESEHQTAQKVFRTKRLVFRNAGKTRLVEFTQNEVDGTGRLSLKVTDYPGKNDFFALLEQLLGIFRKCLPQLGKTALKGLALNYVDLIVPANNQAMNELVTREICPPQLTAVQAQKFLFGSSFRLVETAADQRLQVAFEEVPVNNGSLTKVLPDHLVEHDKRCGLSIQAKEHWWNIPTETYGILDTQHIFQLQQSVQFQEFDILEKFRELQVTCSSVFNEVTTETARASWA